MSITKAANGKYRVAVFGKVDPKTGKRISRSATVATRGEAKKVERRLQEQLDVSKALPGDTFGAYLSTWLEGREPELSFNTRNRYQRSVDALKTHLGQHKLSALSRQDLKRAYAALCKTGGKDGAPLQPQTVKSFHMVARLALEDAVRDELIHANPALHAFALKIEKKEVELPPMADVAKLIDRLRSSRYFPAVMLMLLTGMRRGEIAGLRWSDFTDDALTALRVRRSAYDVTAGDIRTKEPKAGSRRTLTLPAEMSQLLRDHRLAQKEEALERGWSRETRQWCFVQRKGTPLSPSTLTNTVVQASRRSGVHIYAHLFRHLHLSQLLQAGLSVVEVQARAGHAQAATTLNVYSHIIKETEDRAADVAAEALRGVHTKGEQ